MTPEDLEALRARLKARKVDRERETCRRNDPTPTHLHGTALVCPCGVALGAASIAILVDAPWPEPGTCEHCGLEPDADFRRFHSTDCTFHNDGDESAEAFAAALEASKDTPQHQEGPPCGGCYAWGELFWPENVQARFGWGHQLQDRRCRCPLDCHHGRAYSTGYA